MMKAGSDATPKSTREPTFPPSVLTGWLVLTKRGKNALQLLLCLRATTAMLLYSVCVTSHKPYKCHSYIVYIIILTHQLVFTTLSITLMA